jgi:hypothetical protein
VIRGASTLRPFGGDPGACSSRRMASARTATLRARVPRPMTPSRRARRRDGRRFVGCRRTGSRARAHVDAGHDEQEVVTAGDSLVVDAVGVAAAHGDAAGQTERTDFALRVMGGVAGSTALPPCKGTRQRQCGSVFAQRRSREKERQISRDIPCLAGSYQARQRYLRQNALGWSEPIGSPSELLTPEAQAVCE